MFQSSKFSLSKLTANFTKCGNQINHTVQSTSSHNSCVMWHKGGQPNSIFLKMVTS